MWVWQMVVTLLVMASVPFGVVFQATCQELGEVVRTFL